jgi:hypothetical protein
LKRLSQKLRFVNYNFETFCRLSSPRWLCFVLQRISHFLACLTGWCVHVDRWGYEGQGWGENRTRAASVTDSSKSRPSFNMHVGIHRLTLIHPIAANVKNKKDLSFFLTSSWLYNRIEGIRWRKLLCSVCLTFSHVLSWANHCRWKCMNTSI